MRSSALAILAAAFAAGSTAACVGGGQVLSPTQELGDTPDNTMSPLGTTPHAPVDWSREWAFVDAFKTSRPWISGSADTWDDGRTLALDANGWVTSLQAGQIARTLMLHGLDGRYPGGRYVVLYEGTGTIVYGLDATLDPAASMPGRDVLDVVAANGGILLEIEATDPADPIRNVRVLMPGGSCEEDDARFCGGDGDCDGRCVSFEENHATQLFHPVFLARNRGYAMVRMKDWFGGWGRSEGDSWDDRPRVEHARWFDGVPVEIMVDLANRLRADLWLPVPYLLAPGDASEMALVVDARLDGGLRAWIEWGDEMWNMAQPQGAYAADQGLALGLNGDRFWAGFLYTARRARELFAAWDAVIADRSRAVRVLATQPGNAFHTVELLDFEGAGEAADALAVDMHFGGSLGSPGEQQRVRAMTLEELMTELETVHVPEELALLAEQADLARDRGLTFVVDEGGHRLEGYDGVEDDETINVLFDAAVRDPRMKDLHLELLEGWRELGGTWFVHRATVGGWTGGHRSGALEDMTQPRELSPVYDALMTFIEENPRWW